MRTNGIKRSPLFYVGDKYKLINQLKEFFPSQIDFFYEPFVGGGTVFLNVKANHYYLNDIDRNLINIHKFLTDSAKDPDIFFNRVYEIICEYGLSRSYREDVVPNTLKKKYKKTYFARFNKNGYEKLREKLNEKKNKDPLIIYILLIYGFNRMLRFNGGGRFNLPVGNVDFNNNVITALNDYFKYVLNKNIKFNTMDFRKFITKHNFNREDFLYLDPPYLITGSEYNKCWDRKSELELLDIIDELDKKGIKFALSNVTEYKGKKNDLLIKWMKKYNSHRITSNYISYYDNGKKNIKEVLVTNYV